MSKNYKDEWEKIKPMTIDDRRHRMEQQLFQHILWYRRRQRLLQLSKIIFATICVAGILAVMRYEALSAFIY